jgi:flagellar biogenesis protein FliO
MQLKYNRQQGAVSSILKTLFKLFFIIIVFIIGIFLIEKIEFPSPKKNYKIEITDEIKKLK